MPCFVLRYHFIYLWIMLWDKVLGKPDLRHDFFISGKTDWKQEAGEIDSKSSPGEITFKAVACEVIQYIIVMWPLHIGQRAPHHLCPIVTFR